MRLRFLGTAAAEGVPAVFCNCPTCLRAKALGGKEVRTRSQILIDDDTLFDFPMDTYAHMLTYKLDLSKIKIVLITHAHMDHCYPQEFCMRGAPFAHGMTEKNVEVLCNSKVREMFLSDTAREMRKEVAEGITVTTLAPYDGIERGDMRIIAVPANHTEGEDCLCYYVERGGKGAILLNDTGLLSADVFERLYGMGARIDAAALDCTYGAVRRGRGRHMGLYDIADEIGIMRKVGAASDPFVKRGARFVATHLSHNTNLDYEGISAVASQYDITVAYDGMTLDVGD